MERNKLYHGDCLQLMREIPSHSVDLILADPPYSQLNKSNPNARWDREVSLPSLWNQYKRIIKPNGAILLFGQGVFAAKLIMSNPKLYRYELIWDKVRKSNFLNCKKMPMRQHEQVLVFYKKPPTYNPQMVRCEPSQRNHSRGRLDKEQANTCYGKYGKTETVVSDFKYPGTIIRFAKEHNKESWLHSTAKPVNLLRYLIRTYSNEGDLVLDNFAGSSSTAIACIDEKRDWIMIEKDEGFFNISQRRIQERLMQQTLF